MGIKKKGRFVLEATILTPVICLLLVYLVFFTLYAHDYAVCVHGLLESGIKGVYRDGRNNQKIQDDVKTDLEKKLSERLLWVKAPEVEVSVNSARIEIKIDGTGSFLPVKGIHVQRKLYRVEPCSSVRRSRWLTDGGDNENTL